jgi:hypothetical protein
LLFACPFYSKLLLIIKKKSEANAYELRSRFETQLSSDNVLKEIEQYFSFIVVGYFKKKTKKELKMDLMNDKHPI